MTFFGEDNYSVALPDGQKGKAIRLTNKHLFGIIL